MHLECLSGIPLHILYKRKFYEENFYQMENNSGQILTQERMSKLSAEFESLVKNVEEKFNNAIHSNSHSNLQSFNIGESASISQKDTSACQSDLLTNQSAQVINKKEILKNLLKEILFKNSKNATEFSERFINLFYVCKICLWNVDKNERVNFFEFKIAKGTAFKRIGFENMSGIHEIFAIATMIKNESVDVNENRREYKIDKILDFYYLNRTEKEEGFYLVKWKGCHVKYSLEYSKFVEAFREFPELRKDFERRKKRENDYYISYYNSRSNNHESKNKFGDSLERDGEKKLPTKIFQETKNILIKENFSTTSLNNIKYSNFLSILDELNNHHVFFLNDMKSIDELRTNFITPMLDKLININLDRTDRLTKSKILICYDNDTIFKKWKEIFSHPEFKDNHGLNLFIFRFKHRFLRILHEMFYLDLLNMNQTTNMNNLIGNSLSTNINLKKILYTDEKVLNSNSEEYFKLIESSITDYNHVKFDIVFIEKNVFLFEYLNLFSKMTFDLMLMDFLEKDSVIKIKKVIEMNSFQKSTQTRLLILKSIDLINNADDFEVNFSNFLYNFYLASDYLIVPPPNLHSKLRMLSKDKQFFPTKIEEMLSYMKREFKWVVMDGTVNNDPYILKNCEKSNYFAAIREENILELDLSFPRIILNFIPVPLNQTDFLQYLSILRERKNFVLNKKQENKTDLIKNLSAFCSFPGLMIKYYLNKLEDKNLKLTEENYVNRNKINCVKYLIKSIFYMYLYDNNMQNPMNENSFNRIHVNVVYSEPSLDTEPRLASIIRNLKSTILKEFDKERKYLHFYSISTDYEEIFANTHEQNVFIFFNSFLTQKITGKFFRRMFNCFKNRNLFIFQLFLENTIEQNLVEEFYSSATDEIFFKDNVLINTLSKETKEIVLKKNLINMKYSNSNSPNLWEDSFVFRNSENKKVDLGYFDGLLILDNCIQIFTTNSNFIQAQKKSEMDWDYILDEYFSEEKLTNSREEFNCIITRHKKISSQNVGLKNNSNISMPNLNQSQSSIEIFDKGTLKKQRLIQDEDEEDLSDDIIRNRKNLSLIQGDLPKDSNSHANGYSTSQILSYKEHLEKFIINNNTSNPSLNLNKFAQNISLPNNSEIKSKICNLEINLLEEDKSNRYNHINQINNHIPNHKINIDGINYLTDKNLKENLVDENQECIQSQKRKIEKSCITNNTNNTNDDIERITSNISKFADNIMDSSNKFRNLSVCPNSSFLVQKNSSIENLTTHKSLLININSNLSLTELESYLSLLSSKADNYISVDILQDINFTLIKFGLNINIRNFLFCHLMKFGLDFDNMDSYVRILKTLILSKFKKDFKSELLIFYFEYMVFILGKCTSLDNDNYYQINFLIAKFNFFKNKQENIINVASSQAIEIKRRIMIIANLKQFLNLSEEHVKEEIKKCLYLIINNLSQSRNLKPKINIEVDKYPVLVKFILRFLRSITLCGYCEFAAILESLRSISGEEFIGPLNMSYDSQQYKIGLYCFLTSSASLKEVNIDKYLIEFMQELYTSIENNILDKF